VYVWTFLCPLASSSPGEIGADACRVTGIADRLMGDLVKAKAKHLSKAKAKAIESSSAMVHGLEGLATESD
jgi:hypothetical protein